jgi:hypothetical protein
MLLILAIVVGLAVLLIGSRLRVPPGVHTGELGSMSDQWLAEHRATNRG